MTFRVQAAPSFSTNGLSKGAPRSIHSAIFAMSASASFGSLVRHVRLFLVSRQLPEQAPLVIVRNHRRAATAPLEHRLARAHVELALDALAAVALHALGLQNAAHRRLEELGPLRHLRGMVGIDLGLRRAGRFGVWRTGSVSDRRISSRCAGRLRDQNDEQDDRQEPREKRRHRWEPRSGGTLSRLPGQTRSGKVGVGFRPM